MVIPATTGVEQTITAVADFFTRPGKGFSESVSPNSCKGCISTCSYWCILRLVVSGAPEGTFSDIITCSGDYNSRENRFAASDI